jgi:hypothetical protein
VWKAAKVKAQRSLADWSNRGKGRDLVFKEENGGESKGMAVGSEVE